MICANWSIANLFMRYWRVVNCMEACAVDVGTDAAPKANLVMRVEIYFSDAIDGVDE